MGRFDNLFTNQSNTQTVIPQNGGRFDNLFTNNQFSPPVQQEIPSVEQPSMLTKIAGGFQEAIGGTGNSFFERLKNAGKTIGGAVFDAGKSVVEHPIVTAGSVVKGSMNFVFNAEKGIAKLVGADNAANYIQDNQDAINEIYKANLGNDKSKETAGAIGEFVGEQIPYILAGEATAALGTSGALAGVSKYGGLSIQSVEKIGKFTKWASDALGFMGAHQLEYQPEEGSRAKAAMTDLLVLSALGGIGLSIKTIKDIRLKSDIRNFVANSGDKSINEIESGTKQLLDDVEKTTGENPQVLFENTIKQEFGTPINIKEIPPETKMGDLAKAAEARGYPEYGDIKFKPTPQEETQQIKKVLTNENVQQVNRQAEQFGGKESAMWERVNKEITQEEKEVMAYRGITLEGALSKAQQIVDEDSGKAYRIAMGFEKSPANTTNTMVNRVLAERAKLSGDTELQAELVKNRTLSQIRRGQEIVSERSINGGLAKDSASFNMKQIIDERTKLFEKKTKTTASQVIDSETQAVKNKIKIPTKTIWEDFINSIKCS